MSKTKHFDELEIGDYVKEGYGPDHQLLVSDYPVLDEKDLDRLEEIGVYRCMVKTEGTRIDPDLEASSSGESATTTPSGSPDKATIAREARDTYRRTLNRLETIISSVHENRKKASRLHQLKPFINRFIVYLKASDVSVSCLTQIKQYSNFTYHHSINVSLFCLLYGYRQGYEWDELREFGLGGLVHDIGKTRIAKRIIRKNADLTPKERSILENHPIKGQRILKKAGFGDNIQKIALQHHFRPDGSGYPDISSEIHPWARIVSVIDEYARLMTPHSSEHRTNPTKAFLELKKQFYHHEHTRPILENLIKYQGLYPVGSLVELTNQDLAIVMENNFDNLRRPVVRIVNSDATDNTGPDDYVVDLQHIKFQKRAVNRTIYDESIRVERVVDYSHAPHLRQVAPNLIENYHKAS
ncbi:MAG: HD-GYP domain-containing protein [bacterium]